MENHPSTGTGPYVVLSDGSTFDSTDGVVVSFLTDKGQKQLHDNLDYKSVENDEVDFEITMDDLLDAYNEVHGTNL